MSSPYLYSTSPERPRMFRNMAARIIWTLVPVVSLSLLAPVPFITAAVKGVVKPWVAVVYVVAEVAILSVSTALGEDPNNWAGLLLILMMITSATHTALLDSDKVRLGK